MDCYKSIAIILVNYNGLQDTIECIESIKKANNYDEIQIIVVDNASDKDEAKLIKQYDSEIKAIRTKCNKGFSYGNNIGIKYALSKKYSKIALLNNDTVIAKNTFELLRDAIDSGCTVAVPKILYYEKKDLIWYGGGTINKWTGNAYHFNELKPKKKQKANQGFFATGCCIMFSYEVFYKVGLLDESYFMYCEDVDYCLRLYDKGIDIKYVPRAKLWHKIGVSSGGNTSAFSTYYLTRNRMLCILKNKQYFKLSAIIFSLITRIIRLIQSKNKDVRIAYFRGIVDYINRISGRSRYY